MEAYYRNLIFSIEIRILDTFIVKLP